MNVRGPVLVAVHELQQLPCRTIRGNLMKQVSQAGHKRPSSYISAVTYRIWSRAKAVKRISTLCIGDELATQIAVDLSWILLLIQSYCTTHY